MGRKSISQDRKKEILEAYKIVIRKEGIEGASIGKLAKQINMPPSLIMHYFNTKNELIVAVARDIIEETYTRIIDNIESLPSDNTKERLVNFLFGVECQKNFDLYYYRLANYLAHSSEEISIFLREKFENVVNRIADYIKSEVQSINGYSIEINEMSSSLLSSSLGFMEVEILRNDQSSFFKNSRVIREYWLKALRD
ncbi:TetR family transcriptional regulator [Mangrovivirga sp. M17]|uniref:TetR family transcriptional regulator n=1 Tax=Mangrovivirga halotolerans TaxID=2993936 RepID=A0ABT3RRT1_9BACT|nr:TetR family transcriptional regulator [Mangrovivirga halotolerans]MCX2743977.1 TetR family transcriptional regulator [Mangrovivirga halotolerans]